MTYVRKNIVLLLFLSIIKTIVAQDVHPELVKSIAFIENKNQWESPIFFKLSYQNSTLFFEKDRITNVVIEPDYYQKIYNHKMGQISKSGSDDHSFTSFAYQIKFNKCSPNVKIGGKEKHDYYHNYFIGNDPSKWASNVAVFQTIIYEELYPEIDLKYYEDKGLLKYEFIVQPGGDPKQIELEYLADLKLTVKNDVLIIKTDIGEFKELKPFAYQIDHSGNKIEISCQYKLVKNILSFELSEYNPDLPLIIDPTLIFSTYSGSTADNWGFTATYDLNGNMYGGGISFSNGYPTTLGAFQSNFGGGDCDISISKFNATGSNLIYATYVGGNQADLPHSMIVNENGELYIFGTTGSANFPIASNAYDNSFNGGVNCDVNSILFPNGSDIIVVKLNQNGTQLLGSTFLGGTNNDGLNLNSTLVHNYADEARGEIILDENSNVYITSSTNSTNFPTSPNAYQTTYGGSQSAIVCKFNHNLSNLIWSTYFRGSGTSAVAGYSLSLGENNSVYFTGGTNASNLSTLTSGIHPNYMGGIADGYVAHLNENGTSLLGFTYFGNSSYDQSYLIKTDKYFHPHIVGQTGSPSNTFVQNANWHYGAGQFITKFSPDLTSIVWSTEFGNLSQGSDISPTALLVDVCNRVYLSGWGGPIASYNSLGTTGLPTTADAFQNTTDNKDYYLMCITDDASALLFGSFFGQNNTNSGEHVDGGTSRFDKQGRIYQAVCAGCGGSDNFPTTPGSYSQNNNSVNCNLAVFKIDFNLPAVVSEFNMPNTVCAPADVTFNNQSLVIGSSTSFYWDFGDGTTSTDFIPTHIYSQAGLYNITLIVHDLSSCNFSDTLTKTLTVLANTSYSIPSVLICSGESIQIGILPAPQDQVTYHWSPTTGLNNPNISNPIATVTSSTTYTLLVSNSVCSDTITQDVSIVDIDIVLDATYIICEGETAHITPAVTTNVNAQYIWSTSPTFSNTINSDINSPNLDYTPTQTSTTLYLKAYYDDCVVFYNTMVVVSPLEVTAPESLVICFNNPEQIQLQVTPSNCTFVWSPTEYIISGENSSSPTVNPPINTTFFVTVTNSYGCQKTISIPVTIQMGTFQGAFNAWCVKPYIFLGDSTLLESTILTDNEYHYSWTPSIHVTHPDQSSTYSRPEVTTTFTVKVTDSFGCYKKDTVTIYVTERICDEPYVFIPNAFTPNGDDINDVLYVRSEILEDFTFRIYNRLGELLFETSNVNVGWDGIYKGEKCTPGVYDYYLEGKCNNKEYILKKGNITLIR